MTVGRPVDPRLIIGSDGMPRRHPRNLPGYATAANGRQA